MGIAIDKETNCQEKVKDDQKLVIETKKKESPFFTRRDKLKNEMLRKVVPWEKITVSLETFPYHIQ